LRSHSPALCCCEGCARCWLLDADCCIERVWSAKPFSSPSFTSSPFRPSAHGDRRPMTRCPPALSLAGTTGRVSYVAVKSKRRGEYGSLAERLLGSTTATIVVESGTPTSEASRRRSSEYASRTQQPLSQSAPAPCEPLLLSASPADGQPGDAAWSDAMPDSHWRQVQPQVWTVHEPVLPQPVWRDSQNVRGEVRAECEVLPSTFSSKE
jgi:hypothetical protein